MIVGAILSLASFLPSAGSGNKSATIVDASFKMTAQETYRQGLGSFSGDENITIRINLMNSSPINFALLTYSGSLYSNVTTSDITYSFRAGSDYYEAMFSAGAAISNEVHFQVFVDKPTVNFSFSWLGIPAKVLFLLGWVAIALVLAKPLLDKNPKQNREAPSIHRSMNGKHLGLLKVAVLLSFIFWFSLLLVNSSQLATFENWYTDAARNPYTSTLFAKVGASVFDTPLGTLSSVDSSTYKFVTWPEMPNLYPIGSVFLFLPFGALLQAGFAQTIVFKMEIVLLLAVSHMALYLFLKEFWADELNWTLKDFFFKPFWKRHFSFALKVVMTYLLYIVLVVYSSNGQFDAVAILFCLPAVALFLRKRYDLFLLLAAFSATFKYQAGIFLFPLILVSIVWLIRNSGVPAFLRNKAVLASVGLATVDLLTAYLSAPYLITARPELIMNGVNAFSPHAQITWLMQAFAVLLTLGVTITCAVYLLRSNRLISLFMVFSLLPLFAMPYFQPWYLPFLFIYTLIPQSKRTLGITLGWLTFMAFVLSFGSLSYNPLAILENIRSILGF